MPGVFINGVFSNFLDDTDYTPIGPYQQDADNVMNKPIPERYRSFYRALTIGHDGALQIHADRSLAHVWNDRASFASVMTAGPVLLEQGRIVFTDDTIANTVKDGVHILQCDLPEEHEAGLVTLLRNGRRVMSCDNPPGQFFHAGNTNPRSALVVSRNGKNITWVRPEL